MTQIVSKKRSPFPQFGLVLPLLLVALLLLITACSGGVESGTSGDFDAQVAAAVEATVAVAVRETVAAQTGVAAPVEAAASDAGTEVAAEPSDNSHAIVEYLLTNGRHFMGNPDAEVVVIEFSDFQ